ncbi:DUF3768 domain-containing protein [Novosphingobium arvoryzae]|uniref:DUF3768 domain-containing protein n=1 Tax=Novosphingobium arvoryzae TaxID=1256514 RepID=A0A918RC81_9SPHN|nr:DUF3768 domain-containing protein [Novosphingobium arvoryzae]GGZ93476.1 hypothetical protein GCM10011617_11680 [Novosphingobium arvoryzae]
MSAVRIAELNDAARTSFIGCRVVITKGIAAMDDLDGLYAKVRAFNDFNERNDPYGEHDFGSVEHEGQTVFFKFDYYDVDLLMHSPEASDPAVTCRVLTIMLAEEY